MGHHEAELVIASPTPSYSPGERFALYLVAEFVNPANDFDLWVRPEVLAEMVGCTPGAARKYLRRFVDDGWTEVIEQGGGRRKHTRYRWARGRWRGREETAPYDAVCEETAPYDAVRGGSTYLSKKETYAETARVEPETERDQRSSKAGDLASARVEPETERDQRSSKAGDLAFDAEFEELWKSYPRKTAKVLALKSYRARRRAGELTEAEAAAAVAEYARTADMREGGRFVMHGSTFFGPNERWRDFLGVDPTTGEPVVDVVDAERAWMDMDSDEDRAELLGGEYPT